jgi:hypothetical protein
MSDITAKHVAGRGRIRVSYEDTAGRLAFRCPKCQRLVTVSDLFPGEAMQRALRAWCPCDGPIK